MADGATCSGTAVPPPLPAPYFFNDAVDGIVNTDSVMGISVSGFHEFLKRYHYITIRIAVYLLVLTL